MAKTKASTGTVNKGGRPSKYREEFCAQAKALCKLGATDSEMADFFGVRLSTLALWKVQHARFSDALRMAKKMADDRVEQSLYRRATGYEHDEIDLRVVDGVLVKTQIRKVYPPDTTACIFWLKNRRREQWRDRIDNTHSGPDGGPVQFKQIANVIVDPAKHDE